jgi:hypothetical protein
MSAEENKSPLFDLKALKELGGLKTGCLVAVDPLLEQKFMDYRARTIKHDRITVNLITKTGLSAYTCEPLNTFLRGPPSIGKTYVVVNTLQSFPKEDVWFLGGLSPTALVHDRRQLVDQNNEPITAMEKPEKDATPEEKEEWKLYKGRLRESHYVVDLQGKILVFLEAPSIETFNKLRPVLSHDTWEISYKFTDTSRRGMLTTHVVLRGWPATIWLSTMEKFIQDFASRSFTHTPEMTEDKYGDANLLTGSKAAFPWEFEKDNDAMELKAYITWFKEHVKDVKAIIPYAEAFAKQFPHKFPRSMRDFKHVLGLIQVSALFHLAQRPLLIRKVPYEVEGTEPDIPKVNYEQQTYVMAAKADYDLVITLWQAVKETTETSAARHHIILFHQIIEPLAKTKPRFTVNDLTDSWNQKFEDHKSSDTIRNWVDFLCDVGWIDKEPSEKDKRQNLLKVIQEKMNGNCTENDLSAFFRLEMFKEWLGNAKRITEKNQILLKESLIAEVETTPEAIYQKYFIDKNAENSNIVLGLITTALAETPIEKADKKESVQFPNLNVDKVLKLEHLKEDFQDKCVACGFQGRMDWQVTEHDGSWALLCGDCGDKLAKRLNVQ